MMKSFGPILSLIFSCGYVQSHAAELTFTMPSLGKMSFERVNSGSTDYAFFRASKVTGESAIPSLVMSTAKSDFCGEYWPSFRTDAVVTPASGVATDPCGEDVSSGSWTLQSGNSTSLVALADGKISHQQYQAPSNGSDEIAMDFEYTVFYMHPATSPGPNGEEMVQIFESVFFLEGEPPKSVPRIGRYVEGSWADLVAGKRVVLEPEQLAYGFEFARQIIEFSTPNMYVKLQPDLAGQRVQIVIEKNQFSLQIPGVTGTTTSDELKKAIEAELATQPSIPPPSGDFCADPDQRKVEPACQ